MQHPCRSQRTACGVRSLLLPHGSQGSNSGHQPLSELSQQPPLKCLIYSQIKSKKLFFLRFGLLCSIFYGTHRFIGSFIFYYWARGLRVAHIGFKLTIHLSRPSKWYWDYTSGFYLFICFLRQGFSV